MQWFKHDTGALSDAKIKKLIIRQGPIGYAVYFHCLELIAGRVDASHLTYELEHDSEIIADNLRVQGTADRSGAEIVEGIMREIVALGLFTEDGGRIYCLKMAARMDKSMMPRAMREQVEASASHGRAMAEPWPSHDLAREDAGRAMLEENRIDKNREEEKRDKSVAAIAPTDRPAKASPFSPPSEDEIAAYCRERANRVDPARFKAFYDSKGWMIGKNKMKDWRAAVRTWEKSEEERRQGNGQRVVPTPDRIIVPKFFG